MTELYGQNKITNIKICTNLAIRENALRILRLLKPCDAIEGDMIRVGRDYDGGYIMLDKGLDHVNAYSLGIGDDVSWDLQMAYRGCVVFQYDHTIERLPIEHENFRWSKIPIGRSEVPSDNIKTIAELIDNNSHGSNNDLILKMDIEGGEWFALEEVRSEILVQFSQIVIEFHWLTNLHDVNLLRRFICVLEKLNLTHQVVHVHANNYSSIAYIEGVIMPDSLEVTYVRKSDCEFKPSYKVYPTTLDMPCDSNSGDIFLGALGLI